ncbi:unnamed protein product [Bemisia tabaci]|uniref:Uncharacterized protein n=1 Tax=Bemisia tabaci TaxID=7038 RepID=A0A9P0A7P1_BEMTA|nr:unnamed protein product [Bemisia tabaci]
MDDLNKTAEDDDKDLRKKNKGTKLPVFGFKEHNGKSGLPIPVSHTAPKNIRPVSASQRPLTPKFRKKHVVQPQADIIRKTPENATLNRFGFQSNAQVGPAHKATESKKISDDGSVRVKINNLTTPTGAMVTTSKFRETHFQSDYFSPGVRCSTPSVVKTAVKTSVTAAPAKVTLHSSHLPRPQLPIKLSRPNSATLIAPSVNHGSPKYAKTVANNEAKARSRSCPKTRPMDKKTNNNQNRFEMSTVRDGLEVTEMIPLPGFRNWPTNSAAPIKQNQDQRSLINKRAETNNFEFSSSSDEEDSTTHGEEKMSRDLMRNEKSGMSLALLGCDQWNEGECEGEAMATDLLPEGATPDDIGDKSVIPGIDQPLRSVLLTIEDQAFAVLAALNSTELIEDEQSPEDLMSISPPLSEANDLPSSKPTSEFFPQYKPMVWTWTKQPSLRRARAGSGSGSPCTPTHPSHSLSICSDERDYFDDEIADQPGLVFDDDTEPISVSAGPLSSAATDEPPTTVLDNPAPAPAVTQPPTSNRNGILTQENLAQSYVCHLLNMSTNQCQSSMYTSSPCESIASDDLVLDFNRNDSSVSLELDNDSRPLYHKSKFRKIFPYLTPAFSINSPDEQNNQQTDPLPRETKEAEPRQSCEFERLLKKKEVHEQDTFVKNELQINLSNPSIKYYDSEEQDQLMDLKRQLILLQQEMEEKNRKICILETQIERYSEKNLNASIDLSSLEKSTSATQTERIKT